MYYRINYTFTVALLVILHAHASQYQAHSVGSNPGPVGDTPGSEEDELNCDKSASSQGNSESFLWTLRRDPPSYFFGTIHVPYSRVWPYIPENVKHAFHRSDNVYFELDLTDRYTVSALANCQLLPQGEYLSNIIPPELYDRLKRHLEYIKDMMPNWITEDQRGKGLYGDYLFNAITGNWERKRPVWVMLMVNSLTESDIRARGRPVLDLYLAQETRRLGKYLGAVEEVEEQCLPLNDLNVSQVLFALNQTLNQHEHSRVGVATARVGGANARVGVATAPYTTDDLIHQYNCAQLSDILISRDTAQLPNLVLQFNASMPHTDLVIARQIEHYFRGELIYKRNNRMAHRITRLLKTHPNHSFFFAFGAGHFIGNNTVIDILREKGYEIEHTPSSSDLYLGENYSRRDYPPLLADYVSESALPSMIVNSDLDTLDPFSERRNRHRHKNGRRRGRKRDRERGEESASADPPLDPPPYPTDSFGLKQKPSFNDLWVKLEATSLKASPVDKPSTTEHTPSGQKQYILYNNAPLCCTYSSYVLVLTAVCMSALLHGFFS